MKKLTAIIVIGLFLGLAIASDSPAASSVEGTVYRIEVDSSGILVQIERSADSLIISRYISSSIDVNQTLALLLTAQSNGDTVHGWPVSGSEWTKFRIQF